MKDETDKARDVIAEHFKPCFTNYIQKTLAGDFAFSLAKFFNDKPRSEDKEASEGVTFSMDGFRKQLHNSVRSLRVEVYYINDNGDVQDIEDIVEITNEIIRDSNILNCVHQPGDDNFNDLSALQIDEIEE